MTFLECNLFVCRGGSCGWWQSICDVKVDSVGGIFYESVEKKESWGERSEVRGYSQLLGLLGLQNAHDYCLGAVFSPGVNTRYSFLQLNGLGRALQPWLEANSGEVSAQ